MKAKINLGLQILLGLIYFMFGLNFFFHFIPLPPMSGTPGEFMGILAGAGYFTVIKIIEVLVGISLLTNFYARLSLVLIAPITVNILLFHTLIAGEPAMAIVMVLLNAYLLYTHIEDYKGALKIK